MNAPTNSPARSIGPGDGIAPYDVSDDQLAAGSTLGGPVLALTLKASGAIEKIYSVEAGVTLIGSVFMQFWDGRTGVKLRPLPGRFVIHPSHQEHFYGLPEGVTVQETVFVLSREPGAERDPATAYLRVRVSNGGTRAANVRVFLFSQLRGESAHDVVTAYDPARRALVAWNIGEPDHVRIVGVSVDPAGYETTIDHDMPVSFRSPHPLADTAHAPAGQDTLGVIEVECDLDAGAEREFFFTFTLAHQGRAAAETDFDRSPAAADALAQTKAYYANVIDRSVLMTPDDELNRGVTWAKANMLRTVLRPQTGWSFVNDPTRSNKSVARDTAWFGYGADYVLPEVSRRALLAYVERQEPSGMIVEYYDVRNGKTADYDLNINDDTPLIVLALLHHYRVSGDAAFLRDIYPAAVRAARYILSQRDDRGLVWCTSTKTSDWGIVGWRNVIQNYRLSGATTELNSECYAALDAVATMAEEIGESADATEFAHHAAALREAIHTHLFNPNNGLYYLNIDVDGLPRSDVTVDLVFPAMFGVADAEVAARIVNRLSAPEFWTDAGIRTVPRDAPNYGPTHGYGLLGGVWVGATFWFAFAAARFDQDLMARSLAQSFAHYARDPRKNNTVPGQFSEWLHGETLVNEGMMLSPWFPPRYVWAAIEGVAGLDITCDPPAMRPQLPANWKWAAVKNVGLRDRSLTAMIYRAPELHIAANVPLAGERVEHFDEDVSSLLELSGDAVSAVGLRTGTSTTILLGNTYERSAASAVGIADAHADRSYTVRRYDSYGSTWSDTETVAGAIVAQGLRCSIERNGFCLLEVAQTA